MGNREKLSECEEIFMSVLWLSKEDLSLIEITAGIADKFCRKWKVQTVATFMTRIQKKGYIDVYKKGRYSYFHPTVTLDEYRAEKLADVRMLLFGDNQKKLKAFVREM